MMQSLCLLATPLPSVASTLQQDKLQAPDMLASLAEASIPQQGVPAVLEGAAKQAVEQALRKAVDKPKVHLERSLWRQLTSVAGTPAAVMISSRC